MKYIKTYEDTTRDEPQIGDWIVAYRPAKDYETTPPYTDNKNIIDIGEIKNIITKPHLLLYNVHFLNSKYFRKIEHILYVAKDKEDAQKYAEIIEKSIKYNL